MTDDARIKARYPRRTATDYLLFIVALIALVGTIVFVAITGAQRSNPPVAGMVRSFEVVSPTQISAEESWCSAPSLATAPNASCSPRP